jgi:para-aminobenzoate synthetase/4-amino-4-deoxychorismate lyase
VIIKNSEQSREVVIEFRSFRDSSEGWNGSFHNPISVFEAHSTEEVRIALQILEQETSAGRWAVLLLAYEAAPAFDVAFQTHILKDYPLAWVAIFDSPSSLPTRIVEQADYRVSAWEPQISRTSYSEAIEQIHRHIESGDTYQVNFTFPLQAEFAGNDVSWFKELGAAQAAGYCAYVNLGRYKILSFSPELFFEQTGGRLVTRPMKGTMPRGRWLEEDERQKDKLASSEKNRAENLMIVDLLRNDLGKISKVGSVEVTKLFDVEPYRTVLQMTSTITSICRPDVSLFEVLQALFPCGSITGAPKICTMKIINELEPFPRGAYTGCIGFVKPGGDCVFNVAIRTIVLDTQTGKAIFNVGGGITIDSTSEGEFEECLLKAGFLDQHWPEFELFETMLLEDGTIFLLERHVQRLAASAVYFNYYLDQDEIFSALNEALRLHPEGRWKLRLFVTRDGSVRVNVVAIIPQAKSVLRVKFAKQPVDRKDIFLYHKTTNRMVYENALNEAGDCDDVILWNESGEITESAFANIVIVESGEKWTPLRDSGLLNGTFKEELLAAGEIQEKLITRDELRRADAILLINSVRKWMPVNLVE